MPIQQAITSSLCVRSPNKIFGGKNSNETMKQESNYKVQTVIEQES